MNNYSNAETFKTLCNAVDNMIITKNDYEIILNILSNYDSRLFVKILEEVANNHMTWQDFATSFSADQHKFEELLKNQEKLYNQVSYINKINEMIIDTNKPNLNNLITTYVQKNSSSEYVSSAEEIEKQNQILTLLNTPGANSTEALYKTEILQQLIDPNTSADITDKLLLSFHDYLVPVDYEFIILNDFDRDYMRENGLTEEEMKKIKSLAAFSSNYYA